MGLGKWIPFGSVPEMGAEELLRAVRAGRAQVVDVRSGPEFRRGHVPAALHLPITRFREEAVHALGLDPARPVVAICLSAHRSIPAVRQLRDLGYEALQLRGGMRAWWDAELPLEPGG